ncbi:hypothetical protein AB6A40_008300 [Gnathostoma spinigerum]|uniref:F-box domain-containing protein n=1 Tax=Gnathostoma spinigerum TaxID=75299 RepID=A0ABD6EP39_9BILA
MTLSSRKSSRQSTTGINDLPVELLLVILQRCHPVTCYRARLVCRRWREAIDEVEDEVKKEMVGGGHARLFICDRRRAILETFPCPPSCSVSVRDLTSTRKSVYYEDCFAHTTLSNWAYRFSLAEWIRTFDIIEVWLQNFGSFLERDQSAMGNSTLMYANAGNKAVVGQNKSGSFTGTSSVHTTVSRYAGRTSHSHRTSGPSGSLGNQNAVPYNLLPSSQQASDENICVPPELDEEICADLTELSSGRFERLADQLNNIQPLHIVFNDLSFYQKRPPLLLFWFLQKLKNLRKLRLDGIQGAQPVELHRVLRVEGLDELVVVQPVSLL